MAGIGADHRDVALDQPARGVQPDAGLARIEGGVVGDPVSAPAGMQQHHVARAGRLQPLALQRGFEVGGGDLVARLHRAAAQGGDVQQNAAGEERLDVLDAQLRRAGAAEDLSRRGAVVEHVRVAADADMRQPVELGAHLADLGGDEIVHPDDLVRAQRPARQPARAAQREDPVAEKRHVGGVVAADGDHPAPPDQLCRLECLGRRHQVRRAGHIPGAVLGLGPVLGSAHSCGQQQDRDTGQGGYEFHGDILRKANAAAQPAAPA